MRPQEPQEPREVDRLVGREAEPAHLILRGVRALDPRAGIDDHVDLVIRDGVIAELARPGTADADGAEVVEGEGLHAFPAFFDPHVHFRTPGREDKEDLETGTRSAAAGGYCGVLAMANTEPTVSTPADIEALRERATRDAAIPVGFFATVTRGMQGTELTEMAELRDAGAVGFSDDGLPIQSARILRRALQYQHLCGGVIALHEEDADLSGDGVMHEGRISAELGISGIPSVSEATAIARDAAIAGYENARIHVQHLSAAASVAAIAAAKEAGVSVSCEVTPHHLCLTDDAVRSLDALRFKMNPPLREESDRQALIAGLKDGTIDCIATDHAPHVLDEKEVPFEEAAFGVTGLETAFAAIHTDLVEPGTLSLELLVEKLGSGCVPFGIEPSTLAAGSPANVALCDLGAEWTVGEEGYESRSVNSWCAGRTLRGRVLLTVAAGRVGYRLRSFSLGVAA